MIFLFLIITALGVQASKSQVCDPVSQDILDSEAEVANIACWPKTQDLTKPVKPLSKCFFNCKYHPERITHICDTNGRWTLTPGSRSCRRSATSCGHPSEVEEFANITWNSCSFEADRPPMGTCMGVCDITNFTVNINCNLKTGKWEPASTMDNDSIVACEASAVTEEQPCPEFIIDPEDAHGDLYCNTEFILTKSGNTVMKTCVMECDFGYIANKGAIFYCYTAYSLRNETEETLWITANGETVDPLASEVACEKPTTMVIAGVDPDSNTTLASVDLFEVTGGEVNNKLRLPSIPRLLSDLEGFWFNELLIVCGSDLLWDLWCFKLISGSGEVGEFTWIDATEANSYVVTTKVTFSRLTFHRELLIIGGRREELSHTVKYYDPITEITGKPIQVFNDGLDDHCNEVVGDHVILLDKDMIYLRNKEEKIEEWIIASRLDRPLKNPTCGLDGLSKVVLAFDSSGSEDKLILIKKDSQFEVKWKFAHEGFASPLYGSRLTLIDGKIAKIGGVTDLVEQVNFVDFEEGKVEIITLPQKLGQKRAFPVVINVPSSYFSVLLNKI